MWLARDLVRFVVLIVLAALLGAAFGAFWHTAHGGDLLSAVRGGLVVVAGLTLLLGAAPGATLDGRVSSRISLGGYMQPADPTGPRINPTAMLIGVGIVVLAIGIFI